MESQEGLPTSKYPQEKRLKCANQAEILRSHQRDTDFIAQLQEKLLDLLQDFNKRKVWSRYLTSDIPASLIYFIFTTGMGNQTLGEEYTGIVQADLKAYKIPSLTARTVALFLDYFGERTLLKGLSVLQKRVNDPESQLMPEAVILFNTILSRLQLIIPLLILIHKSLFYIFGRYYTIGKRLTKTDYLKVYGASLTNSVSWGLRLLGIATLMQCALKMWQNELELKSNENNVKLVEADTHRSCQLCTEAISTTVTSCGHIFCWTCISNWLRNKPQCPLCRETVAPQRIVYLLNL